MSFKKTCNVLSEGVRFGCKTSGGVLRPALAPVVKSQGMISNFIYAGYSAGEDCYYASDGQSVFTSPDGLSFVRAGLLAGSFPFMVEDICGGKSRTVLFNGKNAVSFSDGACTFFSYGANLTCGVMHCGRLFGADAENGLKLKWSGEGGINDWTDNSGNIILDPERGDILDMTVFGGKLVAVRKYGLTVLNMYGSPENFSVSITDTDTDEIYKGTAQTAGGKLIFATSGGLCSFDGSRIERLSGDISPNGRAQAYSDRYFIGCGKGLYCYDTRDGESFYINVFPQTLCAGNGIYAYTNAGAYSLEEGSYTFESEKLNFGTGGKKTVTKIYIDGRADVEISNGRLTRVFSDASGIIRPNLRGENFTVKLTGKTALKEVTATAEVLDAV